MPSYDDDTDTTANNTVRSDLIPTKPDGTRIILPDMNEACIIGTLKEFRAWSARTNKYQLFLKQGAVYYKGITFVDSVQSVFFNVGMAEVDATISERALIGYEYGAEKPCPSTPARIAAWNAKIIAAGK